MELMLCTEVVFFLNLNNLLSDIGLIDAKMRASDKDLPVKTVFSRFVWLLLQVKCTGSCVFKWKWHHKMSLRTSVNKLHVQFSISMIICTSIQYAILMWSTLLVEDYVKNLATRL